MSKKSICLSMILLLGAASQGLSCDVSPAVSTPTPSVSSNNKARPIRLIEHGPYSFYGIIEQRLVRWDQVMEHLIMVEDPDVVKKRQKLQLQFQPDDWVFYLKEASHRDAYVKYAVYNPYTGEFIADSEMISFRDTNEVIPPIELTDTQSMDWHEVKSTQPEECRIKVWIEDRGGTALAKRHINATTIRLPPPIDPIDKAHTGHFIWNLCK
jgi:hypothetical protein